MGVSDYSRCSIAMFEHNFSKRTQSLWWEGGGGVYVERSRRTPLIRLKKYVKTKILKDNEDINIVKKHQAIREEFVEGLETLHGSVYLADLIKGL